MFARLYCIQKMTEAEANVTNSTIYSTVYKLHWERTSNDFQKVYTDRTRAINHRGYNSKITVLNPQYGFFSREAINQEILFFWNFSPLKIPARTKAIANLNANIFI